MTVDYVADFKTMNKINYKDTRITLTEAVPFFVADFEHVLACWNILRNNKLEKL